MPSDDSEAFYSALTTVCCLALCNWDPRLVDDGATPVEALGEPEEIPPCSSEVTTLRLPALSRADISSE